MNGDVHVSVTVKWCSMLCGASQKSLKTSNTCKICTRYTFDMHVMRT